MAGSGVQLLMLEEANPEGLKLTVEFDIVEGRIWKWVANEIPG